jgi:hypothetical protein
MSWGSSIFVKSVWCSGGLLHLYWPSILFCISGLFFFSGVFDILSFFLFNIVYFHLKFIYLFIYSVLCFTLVFIRCL